MCDLMPNINNGGADSLSGQAMALPPDPRYRLLLAMGPGSCAVVSCADLEKGLSYAVSTHEAMRISDACSYRQIFAVCTRRSSAANPQSYVAAAVYRRDRRKDGRTDGHPTVIQTLLHVLCG